MDERMALVDLDHDLRKIPVVDSRTSHVVPRGQNHVQLVDTRLAVVEAQQMKMLRRAYLQTTGVQSKWLGTYCMSTYDRRFFSQSWTLDRVMSTWLTKNVSEDQSDNECAKSWAWGSFERWA